MGRLAARAASIICARFWYFLDAMVMTEPEFMGGVIQGKSRPTGLDGGSGALDHLTGQLTAFGEYIQRVKAAKFVKTLTPMGRGFISSVSVNKHNLQHK